MNKNTPMAVARAKELLEFKNPSTGIYKLIEILKGDTRQSLASLSFDRRTKEQN